MRLLVVDDEPSLCQALELLFGWHGIEVTTALSATDATRALHELEFDVLLIDLSLGGLPRANFTNANAESFNFRGIYAPLADFTGTDLKSANFDSAQRAVLAGLADVLIPAGDGMPSASAASVAEEGLDQVLTAVPSLVADVAEVLARAKGCEPVEFVARLAEADAAAYGVLTEVVAAAYFLNSDVRKAVGYTGQGPSPLDPRADYMEDGLLESVIKRGPIYRPTPKA